MNKSPMEVRLDEISFPEQKLLDMSTDHSSEHTYAADFRIGFRYGFNRGKEAAAKLILDLPEVQQLVETLDFISTEGELQICITKAKEALKAWAEFRGNRCLTIPQT